MRLRTIRNVHVFSGRVQNDNSPTTVRRGDKRDGFFRLLGAFYLAPKLRIIIKTELFTNIACVFTAHCRERLIIVVQYIAHNLKTRYTLHEAYSKLRQSKHILYNTVGTYFFDRNYCSLRWIA